MSSKIDALKRYMGGPAVPEEKLKKKRKKKKSDGGLGMFVIDDDDAWDSAVAAQGKQKDLWHDEKSAYNEDLPTIVDGTDYDPENQPVVANAEEFFEQERAEELEKQWQATETKVPSDPSPPRKNRQTDASSPRKSKREPASPVDASPPRRTIRDKTSPIRKLEYDASPPRRASIRDADHSPPRRKRQDDASPPRRPHQKDPSPPRRHRQEDASPPRRGRQEDPSPSRRPRQDDSSPPRRSRQEESSPSRRRQEHLSPPRRSRRDDSSPPRRSNRDASPPRRSREGDRSPPRRKSRHDDDTPPRRSKVSSPERSEKIRSDDSPPRRSRRDDASPPRRSKRSRSSSPRRSRYDRHSPPLQRDSPRRSRQDPSPRRRSEADDIRRRTSSPPRRASKFDVAPTSPPRQRKSPSPARRDTKSTGGVFTGKQFKEQQERHREEQNAMFKNEELMGKQAETVYRDKRGRKLDMLMEMQRQQEIQDGKRKREAKEEYEWGTGKVRKEEIRTQQQELEAIKSKPFARRNDDAELEALRKAKQRDFDPVQSSLFKKDDFEEKLKPAPRKNQKPKYTGPPAPPNRFNIPPGYRWDGVVRGTNWEEKVLLQANARKAHKQDMYQWATADM